MKWHIDLFECFMLRQLSLACQVNKPILLHEKGAHSDMLSILNQFKGQLPTVVLHSFVGTFEEASAYLQFDNVYVAVSGK